MSVSNPSSDSSGDRGNFSVRASRRAASEIPLPAWDSAYDLRFTSRPSSACTLRMSSVVVCDPTAEGAVVGAVVDGAVCMRGEDANAPDMDARRSAAAAAWDNWP